MQDVVKDEAKQAPLGSSRLRFGRCASKFVLFLHVSLSASAFYLFIRFYYERDFMLACSDLVDKEDFCIRHSSSQATEKGPYQQRRAASHH